MFCPQSRGFFIVLLNVLLQLMCASKVCASRLASSGSSVASRPTVSQMTQSFKPTASRPIPSQTTYAVPRASNQSDFPVKNDLSFTVYNVEWQVSGETFRKKIPQAVHNVISYLMVDNPDFVVILEATKTLMEMICPQKTRPQFLSAGPRWVKVANDGSVFGQNSAGPCSYIFDQSGPEGIAILFKPQKYTLKARSCIEGPALGKHRDEIHSGEAALQNCFFLPEGTDFTHLELDPPDHRTMMLAQFEEVIPASASGVKKSLLVAGLHPGHLTHDKDLPRLETALRKFHEDLASSSNLFIMAGDLNTAGGIHTPWQEKYDKEAAAMNDPDNVAKKKAKKAKKAKPAIGENSPEDYMRTHTWQFREVHPSFENNSITHVLTPFLSENGYGDLLDAAAEGNAAVAEKWFPAKADELTCCCVFEDKKTKEVLDYCHPTKFKFSFDHILIADADTSVKNYGVTLGQPKFPSSDHYPLKMTLEWNK